MVRLRVTQITLVLTTLLQSILAARKCDTSNLYGKDSLCYDTETCVDKGSGAQCECLTGYERVNDTFCRAPLNAASQSALNESRSNESDGGSGHVAAAVVSVLVIAFVICAVFVGYKYKLHNWVRSKFNQRNSNYDEFMIGQDMDDDPPLG